MQNRFIFIIKRWADIIAYGIAGALAFLLFGVVWNHLWSKPLLLWVSEHPLILDICLFLLLFVGNKIVGTRLRHFKNILTFPPISIAVLIALLLSPVLFFSLTNAGELLGLVILKAVIAAAIFTVAWTIEDILDFGFSFLSKKQRIENNAKSSTSDPYTLSDSHLLAWLEREEPVESIESDLFGHHFIAEKLLHRLDRGENTIALHGTFGSGKSSVVAMAMQLSGSRKKPPIFAEVSCWGFETAASAQEAILSELVRRISEDVDCLSVRGIPSAYLDAVSEHVTWFKAFRVFFKRKSPLDQLKRLSPLLCAINRKAVIVIEDADRNGSSFDISQIQALLIQFREVRGLSFILAISSSQQIDFARVCDYLEIVPFLEKKEVLSLVNQVRRYLLQTHPPAILLDKIEPLPEVNEDYPIHGGFLTYYWPWPLALWGVVNNPRTLKHVLRRVVAEWPKLSGEVRIDDLIGITALRVGAPEAFTFFTHNFDYFEAASQKPDKNLSISTSLPDTLKQEWLSLTQSKRFDVRSVAWLMKYLCTATSTITGASQVNVVAIQTMDSRRRGSIYAKRLFTESLDQDKTSDQNILQLLQSSQKDATQLSKLAQIMTESEFASLAFEDFAPRINYSSHVLQLQTEIYSRLRAVHGVRASSDNQPGFRSPWRLVQHNYPDGCEIWLTEELRKCISNNIRLLNDIYHCWIGNERYTLKLREQIRKAIYESVKSSWESADSSKIAAAFDPDYPYSLSHLVFAFSKGDKNPPPYGTIEEWPWLGKVLIDALKGAPSVMLPQVMMLLNTSSGDPAMPRYGYDLKLLAFLFKDKQKALLELIAGGFRISEDMPQDYQYTIKAGIEQAIQLLAGSAFSTENQCD